MEVSYRQAKRIWRRYQKKDDVGLIHKSRGKPSTRAIDEKTKKVILKLYQEKYNGFGATFAVEKLTELPTTLPPLHPHTVSFNIIIIL